MQIYPAFRYRDGADGTLESVIVHSPEAAAALGDGWRPSPDPHARPSVDPASLPVATVGRDVAWFPSYRYQGAESRLVHNAEEAAALGEGWTARPTGEIVAAPPPAPASQPDPVNPNVAQPALSAEEEAAARAELYDRKPKDLLPALVRLDDAHQLMRVAEREIANPRVTGGRKTILNAINARMHELAEREKGE